MYMSTAKTRITAFIEDGLAKKFTDLTRRIGVSGTALLSRGLPDELKYLAELPGDSEGEEKTRRPIVKLGKMRRFNITLRRQDAERMDQLCREKQVPRDSFIGAYLLFLVGGEEGVCEAPLKRISEMLMNPRREYEEKRKSAPTADTTLYDLKDESFTFVEAVPRDNPYRFLHRKTAYDLLFKELLDLVKAMKPGLTEDEYIARAKRRMDILQAGLV